MILYRYVDTGSLGNSLSIDLETYAIVRETPQGYWVIHSFFESFPNEYIESHKRWVSKTARKRFCYPTKTEAWASYRSRKNWQVRHTWEAYERAQKCHEVAKGYSLPPERTVYVANPPVFLHD